MEVPIEIVVVEEATAELAGFAPVSPTHDTASTDLAFILYTSGTTKNPKGAAHTHGYTWAKRLQAEHWLDVQPGDLVWCTAGTGWAKSIWNVLLGPWSRGAETVIQAGGFDADAALRPAPAARGDRAVPGPDGVSAHGQAADDGAVRPQPAPARRLGR